MKIIYHHRTQGTGAEGVHISQAVAQLRELGATVEVVSPLDVEPGLSAIEASVTGSAEAPGDATGIAADFAQGGLPASGVRHP